jgi:hypothetical protein
MNLFDFLPPDLQEELLGLREEGGDYRLRRPSLRHPGKFAARLELGRVGAYGMGERIEDAVRDALAKLRGKLVARRVSSPPDHDDDLARWDDEGGAVAQPEQARGRARAREKALTTRITFSLPHQPGRWRRLGARVRAAGAGEGRTVVSTPGPGWYEERVEAGTRLVVRLEGERRHIGTRARAEITIEVTGDPTDVAHLQLGDAGPALTMAGVREVPPAPEGV